MTTKTQKSPPSVTSRRRVIAGLAVAPMMAGPAIAAADDPDAGLLALFDEWERAKAAQDIAYDAILEAEMIVLEYEKTLPEVCKYRPNLLGHRYKDPRDSDWSDLSVLTERKASGIQFQASAYETMRRFAIQNEWFQDHTVWSSDGWHAPYSPPLKARVAEILAAYDPWNAESNRIKAETGCEAKRAAYTAAFARVSAIERQIAGTPARTHAGLRAKAAVVLSAWASVDSAREVFAERLADPDECDVELMETSLALDLIAGADEAHS